MKHVVKRIADIKEEIDQDMDVLESMDSYYTPRKFQIIEKLNLLRDELRSLENFLADRDPGNEPLANA